MWNDQLFRGAGISWRARVRSFLGCGRALFLRGARFLRRARVGCSARIFRRARIGGFRRLRLGATWIVVGRQRCRGPRGSREERACPRRVNACSRMRFHFRSSCMQVTECLQRVWNQRRYKTGHPRETLQCFPASPTLAPHRASLGRAGFPFLTVVGPANFAGRIVRICSLQRSNAYGRSRSSGAPMSRTLGERTMAISRNAASHTHAAVVGFRWNSWRPLLECKLCRSITFSVFLLILAIESIILVPSALNFYNNELRRLEEKAVATVGAVLAVESGSLRPDHLQPRISGLLRDTRILGLSVLRRDGSILARAGDADFDDFSFEEVLQDPHRVVQRRIRNGRCYDIAWSRNVNGTPLILLARMDSSALNAALLAFVLRIAGLVALIVAVVTTGTMIVLHRSVLNPILTLRRSMLAAAAKPGRAHDFRIRERPSDELGDVFEAHNRMLRSVAESKLADRLRAEEQARFLVRHDTLTGLPNRAFLLEHLRQLLQAACQRGESVVVFAVNLAAFRAINDGLGEAAGDQVLREAARRLNEGLQARQFVARLDGDNFAIARAGAIQPPESAAQAEQILARLSQPVEVSGAEVRLQAKIGIAYSKGDCVDPETLLHDANLALSSARRDARTRYEFFAPSMAEEARRRQEIERELKYALEHEGLQLYYQPKVELDSVARQPYFVACEALMRWPHPRRGMLPPAQFIPVAEATGLILPLGDWALRAACAQICSWQAEHRAPPRIAVNLSAEQFRDRDLPERVGRILQACGTDPALLELEITESAAMEDAANTVKTLSALRKLGVQLAIDDFGTGYSSLSYLRKFDIDSIKIDKSFVDDIGRDPNADAICEAIIGLGRSLGKRVVAEGVETDTQLEFLRGRGCHEAQGYLFGRPAPAAEFAAKLARRD
ncbi:MAG: EAL domain-containing protein [Betaproteobacteria bacterium]|nr:EAL domain-containing protein [Betaproteobacteria bacterium]